MINITTNSLKALMIEVLIDLNIIDEVPENLRDYVPEKLLLKPDPIIIE